MNDVDYKILDEGDCLRTEGLSSHGLREIEMALHQGSDRKIPCRLLETAAKYAYGQSAKIESGEKLSLMSWIFQLQDAGEFWELFELDETGEHFVQGCSFAEKLIAAQAHVCVEMEADIAFARTDQMVAVSDGVLSGETPIEGVRYPSPDHMSGWWLTTGSFDGDTSKLKTVHMGHVLTARRDIPAFLALPFGYRFRIGNETNVWFDSDVAKEVVGG